MPDVIWDLHSHFSAVPGNTPEERIRNLLVFVDRMGIERICLYMGMSWANNPTPQKLRQDNDEVLRALRHYPDRLFGFAYVSGEHPQASVDEINRCVRDGPMVGIKLWVAKKCSDPALDPIVARAGELKAAIFQHTWIKLDGTQLPGESTPSDVATLAKRHPGVPIICGHTGGSFWEWGIRAIRSNPLIYADLAGGDPTTGYVEMAMRELGPERIIYGSDIGGRSLGSQLAKVYGAGLSERDRKMILAGNLRRLLTPILTAKGMKV
jgi:predicted TIM-barrel fold metal-dependent hydrolase